MLIVGDHVRVLPPFDAAFPGVYTVDAVRGEEKAQTVTIYGDRDFAANFVEVTLDPVTHPSPVIEPVADSAETRLAKMEAALIAKGVITKGEIDSAAAP